MDHVHDKRWHLPLWFLLFSSSFPKSIYGVFDVFADFQSFVSFENSGSHLAMSTDDRFLQQSKQILQKFAKCDPCQTKLRFLMGQNAGYFNKTN